MKPVIREILQYVIDHPEMTTRAAVDSYFDQFLELGNAGMEWPHRPEEATVRRST